MHSSHVGLESDWFLCRRRVTIQRTQITGAWRAFKRLVFAGNYSYCLSDRFNHFFNWDSYRTDAPSKKRFLFTWPNLTLLWQLAYFHWFSLVAVVTGGWWAESFAILFQFAFTFSRCTVFLCTSSFRKHKSSWARELFSVTSTVFSIDINGKLFHLSSCSSSVLIRKHVLRGQLSFFPIAIVICFFFQSQIEQFCQTKYFVCTRRWNCDINQNE